MSHIQAKNFAPNLLLAERSEFFSSLLDCFNPPRLA